MVTQRLIWRVSKVHAYSLTQTAGAQRDFESSFLLSLLLLEQHMFMSHGSSGGHSLIIIINNRMAVNKRNKDVFAFSRVTSFVMISWLEFSCRSTGARH